MFFFLRPIRLFVKALVQDISPNQMGLAFALGVTIGLVPKGNLIAIVLMMILGIVRMNLGVGMLTAFAVSMLSPLLDPLTHQIGLFLLNWEPLLPLWVELYNLPLVPWTDFNNTVVLGSFALGLTLFLPAFFASRPVFRKYTPDWSERLQRTRLAHMLWGGELTTRLN